VANQSCHDSATEDTGDRGLTRYMGTDSTGTHPPEVTDVPAVHSLVGREVLVLTPDMFSSPGGIARHCRLVCRALSDLGARVSVVALHDDVGNGPKVDADYRMVSYVACEGRKGKFVRAAILEAQRHPSLVISEHAHFAPVAWLASHVAGAPLVVVAHGIEVWGRLKAYQRWAFVQADRVLCVSNLTVQRSTASNGLPLSKTRLLHNCLDPQLVPEATGENQERALSLLTVSRMTLENPYKGQRQVIEAMPRLLTQFPGLVYDIVGEGDGRASLEALCRKLDVSHAVRFHGSIPDSDLPGYYAKASIFVMPSQSEGFGYVFLEAMAQGTPVIGGNRDAAVEVIAQNETGYAVDPTSVDAIADAIVCLLQNAELRERMGQAARDRVARIFSFEQFKHRLWKHLDELSPLHMEGV
jgi:glycosyltransferase involved in cell wall biosynthesis